MTKKVVRKKEEPWWQETIDTPETEIVEENFFIEESFIKNKDLIRIDMNIVQFPIFSKNTKRKVNQIVKYYFNKNRDTYITVTPTAGNYIPGEMEEKVFIALMQIMKEKGMPKKFIVSGTELRDKLKLSTVRYGNIVKNALLRLSETNYNFKNTMYSSEYKGIINKEISTPILTLEIITLSLKENKKYREIYEDRRVKEVYEINISDHFYNNIIQKGYMVYNSGILLEISTSTARTVYMLIEKLRFNNIYIKVDTMFLIKRIPLKFDKRNIVQTIRTLEKALGELKDKGLIKEFEFIKEKTWEKSEIGITFFENSVEEKQQRFFEDRNDFRKLLTATTISDTEHDMIEDVEVVQNDQITQQMFEMKKRKSTVVTEEMIDKILGLMPTKARSLKTMPKTIKDSIIEYGYEKVEAVAIYMKKNNVEKVRAYFIKALENDWVEDEVIQLETPKKNISQSQSTLFNFENESIKTYDEELEYFNSLSDEKKAELEEKVYRAYIDECGEETKIQKLTFNAAKKKLIAEYISKNQLLKNIISENLNENVKENFENTSEKIEKFQERTNSSILTDPDMFNDFVEESINVYKTFLKLSDERILEIKKEVLSELLTKFILKTLTLEDITKTITEKMR
nr:hypothetical protein [uncultured Cetobacterium sp.]